MMIMMRYASIRRVILLMAVSTLTFCTSAEKAKVATKKCHIGDGVRPVLALLSSLDVGGVGGQKPMRTIFTGDMPPRFVLYKNRYAIFTKKKSGKKPFYGYQCARLSSKQYKSIMSSLNPKAEMPELFKFFDSSSRRKNPGYSELFWFKSKYECSHFELKGTVEEAAKKSSLSRSSVAPRVSEAVQAVINELMQYNTKKSSAWFPAKVTLSFKLLDSKVSKAEEWPAKTFPLTKLTDDRFRLTPSDKSFIATAPISLKRLRTLFGAIKKPVRYEDKVWRVGYRLSLPHEVYWASPYPVEREEYTICNRYISRRNYFQLYGFSFL